MKKFLLLILLGVGLRATAQKPTVTSFSPLAGPVGTTITLTGTNFNTMPGNNLVFFGAVAVPASSATATSITVKVPAGASYHQISVLNTVSGLAGSSRQYFNPTFTPNKGSIGANDIAPKQDFATTSNSISVAIGDLDGDGKPDLAITNYNLNTVSVFRNTSSSGSITESSFAIKQDFATGNGPNSVAIGDLDGDGKLDLAVTNINAGSNTVSVMRNISSTGSITAGSFAPKQDFTTGTSPRSVTICDLDGDGKPDLAVVNFDASTVSVLRNTGNSGSITAGSFAPKQDFTTGDGPRSLAIGDLDGDGKPDLAVANYNSNTVSLFRNTSSAGSITASSFAAKEDFATGNGPYSVAIGDLDGDGKPDLAVTILNRRTVSVFRNTSSSGSITPSSFATKQDFATELYPYFVAIGDLNGDGKPDLAVTNFNSKTVSVFRNTSSTGSITASSFAEKQDFPTGNSPHSVAIGDLDGDGKLDLAVANSSTVSVLRNLSNYMPDANGILYVNKNVTGGTGDGSSWANAIPELADALKWANDNKTANAAAWATTPLSIYVAKGTYKPMYTPEDGQNFSANPTNPRDKAFLMVNNVKLYGGFDPDNGITDLSHNRIVATKAGAPLSGGTILSGDIDAIEDTYDATTDKATTGIDNNAYHVIVAASNSTDAINTELDGFSIRGGNANGASSIIINGRPVFKSSGGAIYSSSANSSSSVILTNSNVSGNTASSSISSSVGGGIYSATSSVILTNSNVSGNTASSSSSNAAYGGGIYSFSSSTTSSVTLTNSNVSANTASSSSSATYGGGIYSYSISSTSSVTLTNSNVNGNTTSSLIAYGGGIYSSSANSSSSVTLTNSNVSGNRASSTSSVSGGGIYSASTSSNHITLLGSTLAGNSGTSYIYFSGGAKTFTAHNSLVFGNTTTAAGSTPSIMASSGTAITNTRKNSLVQDESSTTDGNLNGNSPTYTTANIFNNAATGDYSLKAGSAAIGAGSNTLYTSDGGNLTADKDLAGNPRVYNLANNGVIDMGAYEYQGEGTLPVSFGKFSATLQNKRVKLDWNTLSETNNEAFMVYRSTDGISYTEIAKQPSKGSHANSYTTYDNNPANGVNYYRLKQRDLDGTVTELGDDAINFSLVTEEVKAWPNPADKWLKLSFAAGKYQTLKLMDISGKKLQEPSIANTQNELELDLSSYPKGVYLVELKGNNGNHVVKVLK